MPEIGRNAWGDPSLREWGQFEWGDFFILTEEVFFADLVVEKDTLLELDGDVVALLEDIELAVDGDFAAQEERELRLDGDLFVTRLPTDKFTGRVTRPLVLVEIRFPSPLGTRRYAGRDATAAGFGWEGRIANIGDVSRALGDRVDDLRIRLVDTGQVGSRIADQFATSSPPESSQVLVYILAIDEPREILIELFRGRIEEIADVGLSTLDIEVVRDDAARDRILGRHATTAIFPGAAEEALGKMVPIVWGQVEELEGLVVDFNPLGSLSAAMSETATDVRLEDASSFPSSGTVRIDDELIAYTSKNGNQLLGASRGQGGTQADSHPSNSTVFSIGNFEVRFADHGVTSIDNVRLMDESDNLLIPSPAPTIDAGNGRAVWSETPTIEVASRSVEVVLVGFNQAGSGNTAGNPAAAARESNDYTDLNYATIDSGQVLVLDRTTAIGELGTITRAGLVIAHDPTTAVGSQVSIGSGTPVIGTLVPQDTLPEWAIRRAERQIRTTYALDDPGHTHSLSDRTVRLVARNHTNIDRVVDVQNGTWYSPERAHDDDLNSFSWTDLNQSLVMNNFDLNLASGEFIRNGFIRLWAGGTVTTTYNTPGNIKAYLNPLFIPTGLATYVPATATATWPSHPTLRDQRHFVDSPVVDGSRFPPASSFPSLTLICVPAESVLGPNRDTDGDLIPNGKKFNVHEVELFLTVGRAIQVAQTGEVQRRSVANFFDVSAIAGEDWSFFTDPTRGGRIRVSDSTGQVRVNAAYWVVEVRPFVRSSLEVPRVFADVRGFVPNGEPTEILRSVLTNTPHYGLGLPASTPVQGAYATARNSLSSSGVRLDFALTEQTSGLELVQRIVDQADLRAWWENGQHYVLRKPNPSSLVAAFRTYRDDDLVENSMRRDRTGLQEVRNRIAANYRRQARTGELVRVNTQSNAGSQAFFGVLEEVIELDLVRSDSAASAVVAGRLARLSYPRWMVRFSLPLFGLELRRGDLISLDHSQFGFAKAEILSLPIRLSGGRDFISVEVTCVVWED